MICVKCIITPADSALVSFDVGEQQQGNEAIILANVAGGDSSARPAAAAKVVGLVRIHEDGIIVLCARRKHKKPESYSEQLMRT